MPPKSHRLPPRAAVIKFEIGKRWLIFLGLTCSILWFGGFVQRDVQFFGGRPPAAPGDFQAYYIAGLVARNAGDRRLYSYRETFDPTNPGEKIIVNPQLDFADPNSIFGQTAKAAFSPASGDTTGITQCLYPPFFSILMSPLTHLPYKIAAQIWYLLSFLFVWLSVFLTVKMVGKSSPAAIASASLITLFAEFAFPMQDLLWSGNVGAAILFLCAAGIFLHNKNYFAWSALFIALAVFIKLTPVIIIPLMIMRRQWRWLSAFAAWSVLLFAVGVWQSGWENHREFLTKIMPAMSAGMAERNNRSLLSITQFVELRKVPTVEDIKNGAPDLPDDSDALFKAFAALSLLGILYYLRRINKTSSALTVEIYLLLLLSLILSPISWRHGYILALVPLVYIWLHPRTQKGSTVELLLLTAATVGIFSVLPDYALTISDAFPFQLLMVSVMPIGVLISMFLLLKIQRGSSVRAGQNQAGNEIDY